jgi:hypothetical protein
LRKKLVMQGIQKSALRAADPPIQSHVGPHHESFRCFLGKAGGIDVIIRLLFSGSGWLRSPGRELGQLKMESAWDVGLWMGLDWICQRIVTTAMGLRSRKGDGRTLDGDQDRYLEASGYLREESGLTGRKKCSGSSVVGIGESPFAANLEPCNGQFLDLTWI